MNEKIYAGTAKYNLIYIFAIHDNAHSGYLKIGEHSFDSESSYKQLPPNCDELNKHAHERIKQYTKTALVQYELLHTELARNDDLRKGYRLGVLNQRGVHWLDPEGKEERELASKFESRANSIEELGYSRFADTLRSISAQYMREAEYNSKHELDDE